MVVLSESFGESALADLIQGQLAELAAIRGDRFTVDQIADNVVARTRLGRSPPPSSAWNAPAPTGCRPCSAIC